MKQESSDTSSEKIYVWDIIVRLFHWLLVVAFVTSYLTGDEWESVHVISGYTIISLLIIRIIWGFVGSKHARFKDFIRAPSKIMHYVRELKSGTPKHYLGHNPAGGLMIVALIFSLILTTASGLATLGSEGEGPLAKFMSGAMQTDIQNDKSIISENKYTLDDDDDSHGREREYQAENHLEKSAASEQHESHGDDDFWEEIHEFFVNLTLILVIVHLAGVFISSKLHGENLIAAMISGYKNHTN